MENTEQKQIRDWEFEAQSNDFLKMDEGTHQLVMLDEGSAVRMQTFGENQQPKPRVDFLVEFQGKRQLWSVTKAKKQSSPYAQLVKIACSTKPAKLAGKVVIVKVLGKGRDKTYFLEEKK